MRDDSEKITIFKMSKTVQLYQKQFKNLPESFN